MKYKRITIIGEMIKKKIYIILLLSIVFCIYMSGNAYAKGETKNITRAYFCSGILKNNASGDCILLENYDSNGNKVYGLIDTGNPITDADGNQLPVVKDYLENHGVTSLQFMLITHDHTDHIGNAVQVLENFNVDTLYIQEVDKAWSTNCQAELFEETIEKAVDRNVRKIIGISWSFLNQSKYSPNFSKALRNKIISNPSNQSRFEAFNETNTVFSFGSSTIQLLNWQLYDTNGNQYITGVTTDTTREVKGENNNSIVALLTQGNKKALFTGDLNNLDADEATGRLGDEDRLKDIIGDIDFLKAGHHGYSYSNTDNYLNTIKPEYVVITSAEDLATGRFEKWLVDNNVDYLYVGTDKYGVIATFTETEVFLGFETINTPFKFINGTNYYIADKYGNYHDVAYNIEYVDENIEKEANSWKELKEIIDSNKNEVAEIDDENKICKIYRLTVKLKSGDWNANESIIVEKQQDIKLYTEDDINILRDANLKKSLFETYGKLTLGTEDMTGSIILDGNKANVTSTSSLISVERGDLNLYKNITLCNNMNKVTKINYNGSNYKQYNAYGSGIYCSEGTVNIYGAKVINNEQNIDLDSIVILPKAIKHNYQFRALGAGIYISKGKLNMYEGTVSGNKTINNSKIQTHTNYSIVEENGDVSQYSSGAGIYASGSDVNIEGGEILNNSITNNENTLIATSNNSKYSTNISSLNTNIFGVGLTASGGTIRISNNLNVSNNIAENNSRIEIQENTSINGTVSSKIVGQQVYISTMNSAEINGLKIYGGNTINNAQIINNGNIGSDGTGEVDTEKTGGGLLLRSIKNMTINNAIVENCSSDKGGGIYTYSSKGTISNSEIKDNNAAIDGGGVYIFDKSSNIELDNLKINNNKAENGNGGGIYTNGTLKVSGENTLISGNKAKISGGGIVTTTRTELNDGTISDNRAETGSGGGIQVNGTLIMNGGTITKNTAKKTGGGIDFTNGIVEKYGGTIEKNTAEIEGNDSYPDLSNKHKITYDYNKGIHTFATNSYIDTDYKVNWDKDFTIETVLNIPELGKRYLIAGNYTKTSNTSKDLSLGITADNKIRVWINGAQRGITTGTISANTDISIIFNWNASTKTYTLTSTGNNSNTKVTGTYDITGTNTKSIRLGTIDYRTDTTVLKPYTSKQFRISEDVVYNSLLVNLPDNATAPEYVLRGWYTEIANGTNVTTESRMPEADTVYYAQWNKKGIIYDKKTITKQYSTSKQTVNIPPTTGGTEKYTYEKVSGESDIIVSEDGIITIPAKKTVGTYTVETKAVDSISGTEAYGTYTIIIEKVVAATPTVIAYSGEYDGEAHGVTVTGVIDGKVQYSENGTNYSKTVPSYTDFTNGAKTIYVKVAGDSNHNDSEVVTSTINITKKTITVIADNKDKVQGTKNPTFTATVGTTGITGEKGSIKGSPTTTATASSAPGYYDITQGEVVLENNLPFKAINYQISFVNGKLRINPNVTFDKNGGKGSMPAQTVIYNTNTVLTQNAYTRDGYSFEGWNTEADGTGTNYEDQAEVKLTNNIIMYAKWKKVHKHTYNTVITKATLAKDGSAVEKCNECGNIKSNTIIAYPKTITLSKTKFTYNKKVKKPTVKVVGSDGKEIAATNYTVTYSNNSSKKVGRYTVTITFKGNYEGTKALTYDIVPKGTSLKKLIAGKKRIKTIWKAQKKQTTGYEIQYATDKKFKKNVKKTTVKKNKTTSVTTKKLKAKKKYYVRIRAYKTVKVNGKNVKIYSGWSKVKKIKTKK